MRKVRRFFSTAAFAGILSLSLSAQDTGSILYSFAGSPDASTPIGGLVADSAGNLYGTTSSGGGQTSLCLNGCGTVYQLSPAVGGGWTETILYRFTGQQDGGIPWCTLIFDSSGNLYGETSVAGPGGGGTVFKLSPNSDGTWSLTTLYGFIAFTKDGDTPTGGLTFDSKGNLYGTTLHGGEQGTSTCAFFSADGCGTAFKLAPTKSGMWTETQLHAFTGGSDGGIPYAGLTVDAQGNVYGTAAHGASSNCQNGCGTVFRISPRPNGTWVFSSIFRFNSNNGANPRGRLVFDSVGNLYGTTTLGGAGRSGTVFELSPAAQGPWTRTVLHQFNGNDGYNYGVFPEGPLAFDASGNVFGTTPMGGANFAGTAYELSPSSSGWTFTRLFSFTNEDASPNNGLLRDAAGNLFLTTYYGGTNSSVSWGTVFELSPPAAAR